ATARWWRRRRRWGRRRWALLLTGRTSAAAVAANQWRPRRLPAAPRATLEGSTARQRRRWWGRRGAARHLRGGIEDVCGLCDWIHDRDERLRFTRGIQRRESNDRLLAAQASGAVAIELRRRGPFDARPVGEHLGDRGDAVSGERRVADDCIDWCPAQEILR